MSNFIFWTSAVLVVILMVFGFIWRLRDIQRKNSKSATKPLPYFECYFEGERDHPSIFLEARNKEEALKFGLEEMGNLTNVEKFYPGKKLIAEEISR